MYYRDELDGNCVELHTLKMLVKQLEADTWETKGLEDIENLRRNVSESNMS